MARVKGVLMLPLVKSLRAGVPDARALLPPHLHRYLDERILVTEWYPAEEHLALLQCLGRAMSITSFIPLGYMLAQYELAGVYKAALHKGDAMRTLRAFVTLWPQNHDTGALTIAERPGGATYTVTDLGLPAREICEVSTGYIIEGMRMAIDKTVRVAHTRCRTTGASSCVWEIDLPAMSSAPRGNA
jgi:hypothetical protein